MISIEEIKNIFCIIFGVCFVILNGWSLYRRKNCLKEVEAECVKKSDFKRRGVRTYFPLMRYKINGEIYENTPIGASGSGSQWFWAVGKKYKIYVNEKHPRYFTFDHKIMLEDMVLGIMGIGFILFGVLFQLTNL